MNITEVKKAVLVIDMPFDCYACKITANPHCKKLRDITANSCISGRRPSYCPLKPLDDAIPIEWIEKHYLKADPSLYTIEDRVIENMLIDWEKENESARINV